MVQLVAEMTEDTFGYQINELTKNLIMMKRIIGLVLVLLCMFSYASFAQIKQTDLEHEGNTDYNIVEATDSLKCIADSIHNKIESTDSTCCNNSEELEFVDSLRKRVYADSIKANMLKDSLINVIQNKEKEIIALRAYISVFDTCMVKLANHCLSKPFNKKEVNYAIENFEKIYSWELKKEMAIVKELLNYYEKAHIEFQTILKHAQDDPNRENPFANHQEYIDIYKRKIENMSYFWKYYKKNWNIIYLNGEIDKALKILKKHTNDKPADFSTLIDPNFQLPY